MGKNYKRNYSLLILATILLLSTSGYLYIYYESERVRIEKYEELALVAKLKVDEISKSIHDELEDALLISKDVFLLDRIENYLTGNENNKINLLNYSKRIKAEHGYEDILIISNDGKMLCSTLFEKELKINAVLSECIYKSIQTKKVLFTDLQWSVDKNHIRFDFVAPILNENKKVIAVLVLRKNPYATLFPLIQRWPTQSETAENLIVRKEGNHVLFLSELKYLKNAALKLKIPLTDKKIPAVMAVLGFKGLNEGLDYRGVEVLADIRDVPNTNWFMITKIDKEEIFAELNFRTALSVIIVLLLILFSVLGFAALHYYRTRNHIKELLIKEKEITSAQEEYKTTLYSIGDGVITTDRFSNVKQVNTVAENLTGWKEKEAIGKPIQEIFKIINEDSRQEVENPVERVLREGKIVGLANHTLLISKNGIETPIADSGAPIQHRDGTIEGVVLVFRDQTDERASKKALQEKEYWLRESQRVGQIGSYVLDIPTNSWISSEVLDIIFGIDADSEKTILSWNLLIHPDHREEMLDYFLNKVLKEKGTFNKQYKIIRSSDNEVRWVWGHGELTFDDAGNPVKMIGTIQDITDFKLLETERLQLLNIIENSLNEIYIFDADTLKFQYVNFGALQNIQYTLEEIKQLTPVDIKPLINEKEFNDLVKPLKTGESKQLIFETMHRRKNGTDYYVEVHLQLNHVAQKKLFLAIINDITERKCNEKALMESEEQFRKMFNVASVGIVQVIPDEGRIINCNQKYCEILGYEKEELLNTPFSKLTYIDDRKDDWQIFVAALRGESSNYLNEKRYVRKDGSLIWVRINAAFIRDDSGKAIKTVAIVEDISERKKIQRELQDREQNLAVTLQSIGDGVIVTDINGLVTNMNIIAEKLTGFSFKEAKGKNLTQVFNIINAKTRNQVENPVEKVIRHGEIVGLANHTLLISKDGSEYQIADSAAPIKENNGNVIGVVLVFRDQTEEYKAQQSLEENEKKLRLIFETSPDAIILSSMPNGEIVEVNEGFSKLTGYSYEEAIGKSTAELGLWKNSSERETIVSRMIADGKIDNIEGVYTKKNGTEIICYTSARFLVVNDRKYLFSVTRDVTEKIMNAKEIERYKNQLEGMIDERTRELNLANKRLTEEILKEKEVEAKLEENLLREKELNQLKSRFISTTSHEFRTPLTTVLSSAELIQRNIGKLTEDKLLNYTTRIKNSVSYLTKLLDDIITLNRADSGKLKYEPKTVDLKELCEEALETSQLFAKEHHKVHFDFQSSESHFYLDEKLMRFIISNLLVNAFKYSPEGGLISLLVKVDEKEIILNFTDEGIGIPEEDKHHLFEPFHRSANSADIPGTGLGLSIVQKSVEIQKGKITFESELNKGTSFTVTIPKN